MEDERMEAMGEVSKKAFSVNEEIAKIDTLEAFLELAHGYVFKGEIRALPGSDQYVSYTRGGVQALVATDVWLAFAAGCEVSYIADSELLRRAIHQQTIADQLPELRLEGSTVREQLVRFVYKVNRANRKWFRRARKQLKINVASVELGQPLPDYFRIKYVYVVK